MDRDKLYQIYHTILCTALTWALMLTVNQYFILKVNAVVCIFFSLVPAVLVYLFDCNRKNTISYLILFCIFPAAGLIFWVLKTNPVTWFQKLYRWCMVYDGTKEQYSASNAHFVLLGASILSVILIFLLMKKQAAKIIVAAGILTALVLLCIFKVHISKIVVCICIFYILTILVELCGRIYSKRTGKPDKKEGILYLAPVCLLLAILAVSMPSKPEPIKWEGIKFLYNRAKDKVDYLLTEWEFFRGKGSAEFGMSLTGYSDDNGKLKNKNIAKNNKIALVIGGYKGNSPIYLIGSVSDVYTGRSWEKSRKDTIEGQNEYLLDYEELVSALSRVDREILENYRFIDRKVIKITYDNIKTKTFFYPVKSSGFELLGKRKQINTAYSNINFLHLAGKGTTYNDIYYEMNLKSEKFQKMLRDADSFSYDNPAELNQDNVKWVEKNLLLTDNADSILKLQDLQDILGRRADIINKEYTQLPDTLPERVRDLAREITKNADTTYDRLKAIEEYLLTYTYSTKPGKSLEGTDFVDYFLFENKKGYCTSFATAFAVLARCVGIPARYVEGYIADYSEGDYGEFYVRNSKAHSWAEAYIEGVGWIPFEATPPFYEYRYAVWKEYKKSDDTSSADYSYIHETEPEESQMMPEEIVKEKKKDGSKGVIIGGIILLSTALILLILLIIYYIILKHKYRKAFEKADYGRKMYLLFLRILALFNHENYVLEPQDTILMLAERVQDKYQFNDITFTMAADVFMRYRYAGADITEPDFEQVYRYCKGLENEVREETGRLKMHIWEFLFLTKKCNR